jgi:hypothetical protein
MTDYAYKNATDVANAAIQYGAEGISNKEDRQDAQTYINDIPKQDWKTEGVSISNLKEKDYEKARDIVDRHYDKEEGKASKRR